MPIATPKWLVDRKTFSEHLRMMEVNVMKQFIRFLPDLQYYRMCHNSVYDIIDETYTILARNIPEIRESFFKASYESTLHTSLIQTDSEEWEDFITTLTSKQAPTKKNKNTNTNTNKNEDTGVESLLSQLSVTSVPKDHPNKTDVTDEEGEGDEVKFHSWLKQNKLEQFLDVLDGLAIGTLEALTRLDEETLKKTKLTTIQRKLLLNKIATIKINKGGKKENDLASWLKKNNLDHLTEALLDLEMDMTTLAAMDEKTLIEVAPQIKPADRKKLLEKAATI